MADIKWFTEEPESYFARVKASKKAVQRRNLERRKKVKAAQKLARAAETTVGTAAKRLGALKKGNRLHEADEAGGIFEPSL